MSIFKHYSKYYDLIYSDKNYSAEVEYIVSLFQNKFKCKNILELGCGTGVHAKLLAEKNYIVHGIDSSPEMIKIAKGKTSEFDKENLNNISFECSDIRHFKSNKKYDNIISLFHVICYLNSDKDLENALTNAYVHLRKGGSFIFDIWHAPAVINDGLSVRFKRLENPELLINRYSRPSLHAQNVSKIEYDIYVFDKSKEIWSFIDETHLVRFFSLEEIKYFAEKVGFSFAASEEWLTGNTPSNKTWSVTIVLNKT